MKKIYYFFTQTWIGSFGLVFFIYFFIGQHFIVPSPSMEKTLLVGDIYIAKKYSYGVPIPRVPFLNIPLFPDFKNNGHIIVGDGPKKGDVVVFRYPKDDNQYFVKRCVASFGDEVIYYDDNLLIHSENKNFMLGKKTIKFNNKIWAVNPYTKVGSNYSKNILDSNNSSFVQLLNSKEPIDMIKKDDPNFGIYFYKKIKENEYYMVGDNRNNSYDSRFGGAVNYKYIIGKPSFILMSFQGNERIFSSIK